ncbi:MAG: efflux RND transporter periplasmic adaptor subunit, partial [Bacteroidaceae bacterium]|nr:efflux RND transporter periplasmic adaptor subunit [Bacteroidaceae bacterium]
AYPDETVQVRVTQVRLEATTTNNVVTYQVVISARNADLKLKPGLTASVSIYTAEKNGVLSVPNKALRFTPDPEVVGPNIKIVNCKGRKKVWVKEGNTLKAIPVTTGITDGINSEVLSGLKNGQSVVTGIVVPEEEEIPGGEKKQSLLQHPGQKKDKK